ncbi:DUF1120 domain-containing protein [Pseudomonas sp. Irchel 3F5]|uniref:DUF1120 domain-containing protein n=1 Tax=Pseudomonas sp. Irchel 3F5 TaxID=2009002 RepID=UPI0015959E0E|nr:DUF1120 domain-containing protein [Pseudomonas sp. Irchel 3F5]
MSKKRLCTLTALLTFVSAGANASSTDVSLTGMITPTACIPTLSAGGRVDFGDIKIADLPIEPGMPNHSLLPQRSLTLQVSCGAPTALALVATGNRRDSSSTGDPWSFGLGNAPSGDTIGHYTAGWVGSAVTLDNLPAETLYSADRGATWERLSAALLEHLGDSPNVLLGFATRGQATPTPAQLLTLGLAVNGWIRNDVEHIDQALMDGSLTVEVRYL